MEISQKTRSNFTQLLPIISGFIIGALVVYLLMRDNDQIPQVDISRSEATADSAINASIIHELQAIDYRNSRDSAMKALKNKPRHEKIKITNNNTALRLNDSILRAAGYR